MTSTEYWSNIAEGLDLTECYDYIVDFFDDEEDGLPLLKWWNS